MLLPGILPAIHPPAALLRHGVNRLHAVRRLQGTTHQGKEAQAMQRQRLFHSLLQTPRRRFIHLPQLPKDLFQVLLRLRVCRAAVRFLKPLPPPGLLLLSFCCGKEISSEFVVQKASRSEEISGAIINNG